MTIEDPPWKKRTRPCPFYSQGRCLFADGCNFLHTVKIRRPDSIVGSEDSDQPDFRLVVDSPTSSKALRIRSPPRSPRTRSLLLALGDIIQQDEEEEWEEGDSGEQESSSGEGSEGRTSGDFAYAEPAVTSRNLSDAENNRTGLHSDAVSDNSARPSPIIGLSEDARKLLYCIPSPPREEYPRLLDSPTGEDSTTLIDTISARSGSPGGEHPILEEDVTVTRFRYSMTPELPPPSARTSGSPDPLGCPSHPVIVSEYQPPSRRVSVASDSPFPPRRAPVISDSQPPSPSPSPSSHDSNIQPPSRPASTVPELPVFSRPASVHTPGHVSSSSRSSVSSVLLSPIEIEGARRISFASQVSHGDRENSFDSGFAEGPEPLRRSPLRTPRRISTLSILSSPFGSPSARVLYGGQTYNGFDPAAPSASALFSPRFGSFPSSATQELQNGDQEGYASRHSRDDSVDSTQFAQDASLTSSQFEDAETDGGFEIQVERMSSTPNTMESLSVLSDVPEESSLFLSANASDHLAVDEDMLRVDEASFGSDDSMASLYDQYYTPTVHSTGIPIAGPEAPSTSVLDPSMEESSPFDISSYTQDSPPEDAFYAQESSPMDLSYLQDTSPQTVMALQDSIVLPAAAVEGAITSSPEVPGGFHEELPELPYATVEEQLPRVTPSAQSAARQEVLPEALSDLKDEYPLPSPVDREEPMYIVRDPADEDTHTIIDSGQSPVVSPTAARPPSAASASSSAYRVFSPILARPSSAASSAQIPNFSLPASAHNSVVFSAPSRSPSPAASVLDEGAADNSVGSVSSISKPNAEGTAQRPVQSEHTAQSVQSSQSDSRKVPFGFRSSDRSRPSRRPESIILGHPKPPLVVEVEKVEEDSQSQATTPLSPVEEVPMSASPSEPNSRCLKPLRLSMILNSSSLSLNSSIPSSSIPSLTTATTATTAYTPSSSTVSSEYSLFNNRLISSPRSAIIPSHLRNTTGSSHSNSPLHIPPVVTSPNSQPMSAPASRPTSWHQRFSRKSLIHQPSRRFSAFLEQQYARSESRLSEPIVDSFDERHEDEYHEYEAADQADETIRRPASATTSLPGESSIFSAQQRRQSTVPPSHSRRESLMVEPVHAIATPRPTLLFALASDSVEEVKRVLESGEARPNDDVGPQSALAFTLANDQLKNKTQMVKLLLAHGADTSVLHDPESEEQEERSSKRGSSRLSKFLQDVDPATRYYIERADSPQTRRASALIHRSQFRPLAKVRYDLIGQDRVLEQLFRVLSMPSMAPIVVLLCGPSGHGKSLLARKFGSLLEVPTHTVNMTTLQNTRDIWKSHSIAPHEPPSENSLKDFLIENEGKRCVVVLDEIEKTQDEKILSSLLMPWEYGRCSFEAGHRHVDVSKVIWLGTSNIGHDLVFEHQDSRPAPETQLSREEYVDLMGLLRPRVSERLGPSLLSRVTAVLPFVAFTAEEKMALSAEALHALAGETVIDMPPATRDLIVRTSLNSYIPSEGARSLYRAVSTLLLDTI